MLSLALQVANFPGNRPYTLNSLVEELALMERHIRDGSWRLCTCNPEKHLPLIAGLSSEGVGFAESVEEKEFMAKVRDTARGLKQAIKSEPSPRKLEGMMDKIKDWGRFVRHKVEAEDWNVLTPIDDHTTPSKALSVTHSERKHNPRSPHNDSFGLEGLEWVCLLIIPVVAVGVWIVGNMMQAS